MSRRDLFYVACPVDYVFIKRERESIEVKCAVSRGMLFSLLNGRQDVFIVTCNTKGYKQTHIQLPA